MEKFLKQINNIWIVNDKGYVFDSSRIDSSVYSDLLRGNLIDLYLDNIADKYNDSYIIPHDKAAGFSKEQRYQLELPDIFPYNIDISSKSDMSHSDFRYRLSFDIGKDSIFSTPQRIGSFIYFTNDIYFMFNKDQFEICRLVDRVNEEIKQVARKELSAFNYGNLERIKSYAHRIKTTLDKYLNDTNVVVADQLTISVDRQDDGNYRVKPILLNNKEIIKDTSVYKTIERSCRRDTKLAYRGTDGTRYVLNKAVRDGIDEIKKVGTLNEQQANVYKETPDIMFNSSAFVFDSSLYGERVEGIGEYLKKNLPYVKLTEGSWLPEEGTAAIDIKPKLEVTKENVEILSILAKQAIEENKSVIDYNGTVYDLTVNTLNTIKEFKTKINGNTDVKAKKQKSDKVLQGKDNFDSLQYKSEKGRSGIGTLLTIDDIAINPMISLYPHQKEGIQWMQQCWNEGYKGVLLADDMGLGKTMQAFAFISSLKNKYKGNMPPVLIVAPVSLLKNWQEEYDKFICSGLFSEVVKLYGRDTGNLIRAQHGDVIHELQNIYKNKIVLTTYETLRMYQLSLGKIPWSVMIVDEAQKIKNPNTMIASAVKFMNYDFGIALSGTPVENTWIDLWSIMDFVAPGKLGDLKEFNQNYQSRLNEIKDDINSLKALGKQLQNKLNPVFLRRLKKDHLHGLPQKQVKRLCIPMPPIQQRLYEEVIQDEQISQNKCEKNQMLMTIAKLRDISLCPNLSYYNDKAFRDMDVHTIIYSSARLQGTFKILDEVHKKSEKVLVFVTSRKMQRLMQYLIKHRYKLEVLPPINGAVMSERRQEVVTAFNNSEGFNVLILSAEAGGVGFNITSANHVIHLSRCWNPAKEDQATDRVYRIGQTKDVNVYLPMAYDPAYPETASFDIKLDNLLTYKRNLSDSVLYPTGDSAQDGLSMFQEIFNDTAEKVMTIQENDVYTLDDLRFLEPYVFEKVICDLYNNMPMYRAELTQQTRDNGADVIVFAKENNKPGYLIQCKHTMKNNNIGVAGIEAVCSSIKYYEAIYNKKFKGIVLTNADEFTKQAKKIAMTNDIELITSDKLGDMLKKYPVLKRL